MKQVMVLSAMLLTVFSGCKKNETTPPPTPSLPPDDARTVLLKDVVAQSLPNPYFHFTYDDQRYIKQISFASGFAIYNLEYENKRVKKMTNIQNNNSIIYSYSNDRVSEINEFSGQSGKKNFSYRFSYNSIHQLSEILWLEFSTDANGHLFKKAVLTYQTDGNVSTIESYYDINGGQLTLEKTDQFSGYDKKANVDDFYLVKEFFDTFLFLPQVKLQKNNPSKQQILGVENDYEITYTYDFHHDLPVKKTGLMKQTRGSGSGQSLQITNHFHYY